MISLPKTICRNLLKLTGYDLRLFSALTDIKHIIFNCIVLFRLHCLLLLWLYSKVLAYPWHVHLLNKGNNQNQEDECDSPGQEV